MLQLTFKLDGSGCRIHSVSDGNEKIVTNERYVVMPWKMVTRYGTNVTLKEVIEEIKAREEEIVCWLLNLRLNIGMKYLRYLG